MNLASQPTPDLQTLVSLFYPHPSQLGEFQEVQGNELPPVERKLLDHQEHMTVTVEAFHGSLVDVEVLAAQIKEPYYCRKILLRRQSDRQVVQFGIVRLDTSVLESQVRAEIESRSKPLGRILIEHNVLREVELVSLWRINPGDELRRLFRLEQETLCYGRTALIYCHGEPAVELLEVVTPSNR